MEINDVWYNVYVYWYFTEAKKKKEYEAKQKFAVLDDVTLVISFDKNDVDLDVVI